MTHAVPEGREAAGQGPETPLAPEEGQQAPRKGAETARQTPPAGAAAAARLSPRDRPLAPEQV